MVRPAPSLSSLFTASQEQFDLPLHPPAVGRFRWGCQLGHPSVAPWIERDMEWVSPLGAVTARCPTHPDVQRWAVPGHSMPQFPPSKAGMPPQSPSPCLLQAEGQGLTPRGPLTSSCALPLQHFIFWGLFRGLNFMLRSWKCVASHGGAVGVWTTTSELCIFQVVSPHSQLARRFENLLHLNHTLHNLFLCFISAPIDAPGPQHGIPAGVPEGWQLLRPPRLSHLLAPSRVASKSRWVLVGF